MLLCSHTAGKSFSFTEGLSALNPISTPSMWPSTSEEKHTLFFFFFSHLAFHFNTNNPLKLQHLLLCAGLFPHWHTTTILSATNRICFSLRPFVAVQAPLLPSRCAARCLREQWRSASGFENISLYIPPTPSPEKHWCLFTFLLPQWGFICVTVCSIVCFLQVVWLCTAGGAGRSAYSAACCQSR